MAAGLGVACGRETWRAGVGGVRRGGPEPVLLRRSDHRPITARLGDVAGRSRAGVWGLPSRPPADGYCSVLRLIAPESRGDSPIPRAGRARRRGCGSPLAAGGAGLHGRRQHKSGAGARLLQKAECGRARSGSNLALGRQFGAESESPPAGAADGVLRVGRRPPAAPNSSRRRTAPASQTPPPGIFVYKPRGRPAHYQRSAAVPSTVWPTGSAKLIISGADSLPLPRPGLSESR